MSKQLELAEKLIVAIQKNDIESITTILSDKDFDPNVSALWENTNLTYALIWGRPEALALLLNDDRINLYQKSKAEKSVLDIIFRPTDNLLDPKTFLEKASLVLHHPHLYIAPDFLFKACRKRCYGLISIIAKAAKEKNCLEQILAQKYNGLSILEYFLQNRDFQVLTRLLEIEGIQNYLNLVVFENLVNKYFEVMGSPHPRSIEYNFYSKLKTLTNNHTYIPNFEKDAKSFSLQTAYSVLFKSEPPENPRHILDANKLAMAQFHALLSSPAECIKYLQFLNEEFLRYFEEKHGKEFSSLNPESYHFVEFDGLRYPVANRNQETFDKHHALEEFLIALFKKYGLAEHYYKWLGFIPTVTADHMMENGDFVTEDQRNFIGLLHGKLSHMLQLAILIYALEDNKINRAYGGKELSLKDILENFVRYSDHKGTKLWQVIRDNRNRHAVTFGDPFQISSTIMADGKKLGLSAISDYLIHSFCKGTKKALAIAGEPVNNAERFFKTIPGQSITYFDTAKTNYAKIKKQVSKADIVESGPSFLIINKTYDLNENFEPRMYSSQDTLRDKLANDIANYLKEKNSIEGISEQDYQKITILIGLKSQIRFSTVPLDRILKDHIKQHNAIDADPDNHDLMFLNSLMTLVNNDCETLKHQSMFRRAKTTNVAERINNNNNFKQ